MKREERSRRGQSYWLADKMQWRDSKEQKIVENALERKKRKEAISTRGFSSPPTIQSLFLPSGLVRHLFELLFSILHCYIQGLHARCHLTILPNEKLCTASDRASTRVGVLKRTLVSISAALKIGLPSALNSHPKVEEPPQPTADFHDPPR